MFISRNCVSFALLDYRTREPFSKVPRVHALALNVCFATLYRYKKSVLLTVCIRLVFRWRDPNGRTQTYREPKFLILSDAGSA